MDEERVQRMMEDPNVQQSMNEALSNPDFVNMLIQSNPMLRNLPNARELITSPFMRQMMTNPGMMSQAMRMQRNMRGGSSAFPAPGATDTTPSGAASSNEGGANNLGGQNSNQPPPMNPWGGPFMPGPNQGQDMAQMTQQLQSLLGAMQGQNTTGQANPSATPGQGTEQSTGATAEQDQGSQQQNAQSQAANPFAALFPPPGGSQGNPFGMNPEMMQQMLQMMGGGGGGASSSPPDNRPPEERYADQLRQLNDMGFFDFDRNVAALRRSGGSVQGAVEYLLSALD